jgi:uncharacterized protein YyaL (SSP411 family)
VPNRLAQETSPYLRQHAANPVDWYPWGPEALERARAEDKPILLSIGYSACHWCHVMAHESFDDPATAALMNRLFVNIKVDREERPDLDHLYQAAHRLLSERGGGWPLTVLLTPAQEPFFSGTYFPPVPRHGLPAFAGLLQRAEQIYRTQRDDVTRLGADLRAALRRQQPRAPGVEPEWTRKPVDTACELLRAAFDPVEGGLGRSGRGPKFPQPQLLSFMLRHDPAAVLHTLRRMAAGGIYDQLGGGFCRYSVDAAWTIPHFEKMLYDNGALLALYADAFALTGEAVFARVVPETIAWALREMRAPEGGFYAALDADSEGEEGGFYLWTREQARACLSDPQYAVAAPHFGLDGAPNFEGRFHLRVVRPLESVAASLALDVDEARRVLDGARAALLSARAGRVRPGLDDKVLAAWNGLMIRGLARAARVFGRADWLAAARESMDFVRTSMWRDGRLFATWQGGGARHAACLDDAAFLLDASLELMQAGLRSADFDFALALARLLTGSFEDPVDGGFFFTAHDHEALIHRDKPVEDGATPGGNGVAALALQRFASVAGQPAFADAARRCLTVFHAILREAPHAAPTLLGALQEHLDPPRLVVLRGPAAMLPEWERALAGRYAPHTMVFSAPSESAALPPGLAFPVREGVRAYVCTGGTCLPPVADLAELLSLVPAG